MRPVDKPKDSNNLNLNSPHREQESNDLADTRKKFSQQNHDTQDVDNDDIIVEGHDFQADMDQGFIGNSIKNIRMWFSTYNIMFLMASRVFVLGVLITAIVYLSFAERSILPEDKPTPFVLPSPESVGYEEEPYPPINEELLKVKAKVRFMEKYKNEDSVKNLNLEVLENLKSNSIPKFKENEKSEPVNAIEKLKVKEILTKASSRLVAPENPPSFPELAGAQPFEELPICLIIKPNPKDSKEKVKEILNSVFRQNYDNFVAILVGEDQNLPLDEELAVLNELQKVFFKFPINNLNYYQYHYIMHSVCDPKSLVMFLSQTLNPQAFQNMLKSYQSRRMFMSFAQGYGKYFILSFYLKVFDLIGENDFSGTNRKYLEQGNKEKFIGLAVLELCKYYAYKAGVNTIYKISSSPLEGSNIVLTPSDSEIYEREQYDYIMSLSQDRRIDTTTEDLNFNRYKTDSTLAPSLDSLHVIDDMTRAIDFKQLPNLPIEHSLHATQRFYYNKTYGYTRHDEKSTYEPRPEKPICVTLLGNNQTDFSEISKKRYVSSLKSVLAQNYTNYHLVYINDGLHVETEKEVLSILKNSDLPKEKITYLKNKKTLFPMYNIMNAATKFCSPDELQIVVENDFELLGSSVLTLFSWMKTYVPSAWVLYTGFKTKDNKFGFVRRLFESGAYRTFRGRVKNLKFMAPVAAWEVRLIRSIPLEYLQYQKGKWFEVLSFMNLQYALTELSTIHHLEHATEITFEASNEKLNELFMFEDLSPAAKLLYNKPYNYMSNRKSLEPLQELDEKYKKNEKILSENLYESILFDIQEVKV